VNVAGTPVRTESVLLLAGIVGDAELSAKLGRAVTNDNAIVALTQDDRERIVAVLSRYAPPGLAELRDVLTVQLKRHKDRAKQQEQQRLNEDRRQRRNEAP
jgi:hypothetical protein